MSSAVDARMSSANDALQFTLDRFKVARRKTNEGDATAIFDLNSVLARIDTHLAVLPPGEMRNFFGSSATFPTVSEPTLLTTPAHSGSESGVPETA